jgi:hypothetical protein
MAEVFVASVVSPVKILLCNTAVECDPTFSFLQLFQLLQKRQSDSSDSIRSLNYDNISSIRIKEHPKETEGIEMTIDMQLKLRKDFNCKYIEYRVNVSQVSDATREQTLSGKTNAFAIMMSAQQTLKLPPKHI